MDFPATNLESPFLLEAMVKRDFNLPFKYLKSVKVMCVCTLLYTHLYTR